MRLGITLPELEAGSSHQTGPSERILDLKVFAHRRDPIAISPISDHDHRIISVILPTGDAVEFSPTSLRLEFKPVWMKTFTLCSARKDSILSIICQFEGGQYWIDNTGWRPCNLTLDGPGTDPKVVHNSQFVMGDLLSTWPRPRIAYKAIELIQRTNGKEQ